MEEQALAGGNASSDAVVRVGDTVRKPWTASTPSVVRYVDTLRAAGVDAPAPLGRDDQGRQVQEFIPGTLAIDAGRLSPAELHRVGALVRAIHDASAVYTPEPHAVWQTAIPSPGDELVCHNDLAPWNLIIGERWVFIDWDAAAPSTRLWDLAYAAQAFTLNDAGRPPEESAQDLAAFVDGYGADPRMRSDLPAAMSRRTEAMYDLLRSSHDAGTEPWATMFTEGHGEHWQAVIRYVQAHEDIWSAALAVG
ncbi:phosphotransferase [Microbacterium sp. zg.Y625]|uniref:phosphotransferase n=1 Tax=Microbacterium jiangjiandongii TaxID=3049071 RepID=UPI00214ABDC3|nr:MULTISPECIES: phosphotransferase [unclassified Microbacterium]MCR2791654.1 phosphotransferase [Microbacterium sp. zg.Y625]WIM26942.1 phosphotransferase [Microbacterium sp. zg-Y625]